MEKYYTGKYGLTADAFGKSVLLKDGKTATIIRTNFDEATNGPIVAIHNTNSFACIDRDFIEKILEE